MKYEKWQDQQIGSPEKWQTDGCHIEIRNFLWDTKLLNKLYLIVAALHSLLGNFKKNVVCGFQPHWSRIFEHLWLWKEHRSFKHAEWLQQSLECWENLELEGRAATLNSPQWHHSHTAHGNPIWQVVAVESYIAFGEGNGNPLQYSCLENPMDGRAW